MQPEQSVGSLRARTICYASEGHARYHYWRSTTSHWTRTPFPLPDELLSINDITETPTVIGKRGKLITSGSSLLAVLPSNAVNSSTFSILSSTAKGHFRDWEIVFEAASGCEWEALYDWQRLDVNAGGDGALSLYMIHDRCWECCSYGLQLGGSLNSVDSGNVGG